MVIGTFGFRRPKNTVHKTVDKIGTVERFNDIFPAFILHFPQFIAPFMDYNTLILFKTLR